MSRTVQELRNDLDRMADEGHTASLGGTCTIKLAIEELVAAAVTGGGIFDCNTDNVVLRAVKCGHEVGILAVVAEGNYKDAGSAVASGQTAIDFIHAFCGGLVSEADVAPTLRRAMLAADASIRVLSNTEPAEFDATVVGRRRSLRGIGACVTAAFALQRTIYLVHLGDTGAVLHRHGAIKKLTLAHTLANEPGFRADVRERPEDARFAHNVTLRGIGIGPEPKMDMTRLDVAPGDQVILGNIALPLALETIQEIPRRPSDAVTVIADEMSKRFWQCPSTVIVLAPLAR